MFLVEEKQIVKEVNSALSFFARKSFPTTQKFDGLVCVMRRLVNIIYGMMKNKISYIIPTLPEKNAV